MTIRTMTAVKTRATSVQPPSALVLMCRKKTVWTRIWAIAMRTTITAVAGVDRTPLITSQNGMPVRITDRTKPIR